MSRRTSALSLLASCLVLGSANAQVQRMAIPAGAFDLAAGAARAVEAFCLDLTRHAPSAGTAYKSVLTSAEDASVVMGGRSMPLQDALERGLVSIEGQNVELSISDLMDELQNPLVLRRMTAGVPPREAQALTELAHSWATMNSVQRAEVARQLPPIPLGGDHTRMKFVNKTGEPMRIVINQATAVGVESEGLDGVGLDRIRAAGSRAKQREVQQGIWLHNDRESQRLLQSLGYYQGALDGQSGPQTLEGIRRFQRDNHIPMSGQFDAATVAAMHERGNARRLHAINSSADGILLATLRHNPGDAARRYVVSVGDRDVVYAGNDIGDLTRALDQRIKAEPNSGQVVYLDLSGMPTAKADALGHTIRLQQRQIDRSVDVAPLRRLDGSTELEDALFARGVRFERATAPELVTEGEGRGLYRSTIDLTVRIGGALKRFVIEVWASTREIAAIARDFMYRAFSANTFDSSKSVAELLRDARAQMRRQHPELSADDVRFLFRDQAGNSYIAQLTLASSLGVG